MNTPPLPPPVFGRDAVLTCAASLRAVITMPRHAHVTLADLKSILADDDQCTAMLVRYGLVTPRPNACPTAGCAAAVSSCLSWRNGVPYWRCSRNRHRNQATEPGSPLYRCRLDLEHVIALLYYWSVKSGAVATAQTLDLTRLTVHKWFRRCRVCVSNTLDPNARLGGRNTEVEADETEIGRRRKGVVGHATTSRVDVRGVFERGTKKLFMEPYLKLVGGPGTRRRFGPPTLAEARALFKHIRHGSIVFTDRARAYDRAASERRFKHASVNHKIGQFTRYMRLRRRWRTVGTQGLDGTWSLLKQFLRRRGNPRTTVVPEYIAEFVWRRNLGKRDPFWALLEAASLGF